MCVGIKGDIYPKTKGITMNNRIYYGEYSLKHWIDLIIQKNITLPEYQRSFVWKRERVIKFIKDLKEKQFIPPVAVAHYKTHDNPCETNLILDGQQRLSSIILAYLNLYPDGFSKTEKFSNDDDCKDDDVEDSTNSKSKEWTFNYLFDSTRNTNTIDSIKNAIAKDKRYKQLFTEPISQRDDFWENSFLGFSYIVPDSDNKDTIQKSFSRTFRDINYLGVSLSAQESRRSLYFMNDDYKDFFDGRIGNTNVLNNLTILENMQPARIDFVRYLAILSQYYSQKSEKNILKHYSSYASREGFYADYVSKIVGLDQENHEDKFDNFEIEKCFPSKSWRQRFESLQKIVKGLENKQIGKSKNFNGQFESWIDADYYLFGLIYHVLFLGKNIVFTENLFKQINNYIKNKHQDAVYSKSPNRLGNLRSRLKESIDVYCQYVG